jgi:membrane protease YdiL (CAAX protease family)
MASREGDPNREEGRRPMNLGDDDSHPATAGRRGSGVELLVLLALLWLPNLVAGVLARFDSEPWVPLDFVYGIPHSLGEVGLIGYLIWRRSGSLEELGFGRSRWFVDVGRGLVLGVVILLVDAMVSMVCAALGLANGSGAEHPLAQVPALHPAVFVSGFLVVLQEELFYRSYLMPRLADWFGSDRKALLVSAALFASMHVYPVPGSLSVFAGGLLMGAAFLQWRSLPTLVIAHWAHNLMISFSAGG